ncbi:MAG TPA: SHOCT domain-containing protein, partial [Gemmatimonadaceae bacterium]
PASAPMSAPPSAPVDDPRIGQALSDLRAILVPGETLEAFAVQRRIFALTHRRLLVAATSGRFITVTRGLFGGYTPRDVRWQDIEEAHVRIGILGATLTITSLNQEDLASAGRVSSGIAVDGLRKEQAESVYRVCQAQWQAWREKRRIRDLDELRAKSGGVQIGAPAGAAGLTTGGGGDSDPVARLQRAKEMLDAGLLTDAEYESIKARIMDRL